MLARQCQDNSGAQAGVFTWDSARISAAQVAEIAQVPHFRRSEYRHWHPADVIASYVYGYVEPLLRLGVAPRAVADIGAGYGWLAIAFALATDAQVTAVEYSAERIDAARTIAAILGVDERITWIVGSIAQLPLDDRAFDAVYCIEVIEHTGVDPRYMQELARIARDVLVVSTPNLIFPIIHHDTSLPFCHWLPLPLRDVYATLCGRRHKQSGNRFWSPMAFLGATHGFERVSRFLHFASHADYKRSLALAERCKPGLLARCMRRYFSVAALLGPKAIYCLPNLASTFRRNDIPM